MAERQEQVISDLMACVVYPEGHLAAQSCGRTRLCHTNKQSRDLIAFAYFPWKYCFQDLERLMMVTVYGKLQEKVGKWNKSMTY